MIFILFRIRENLSLEDNVKNGKIHYTPSISLNGHIDPFDSINDQTNPFLTIIPFNYCQNFLWQIQIQY